MPTFVFYSDKVKVEMMRGANPQELEQKVRHWAETAAAQAGREPCPVPGQVGTAMECLTRMCFFSPIFSPIWTRDEWNV
jgi:hypothetical protein